tara:strand:- start:1577 stop:2335 length:759 start_codon:yes stop_codon:yes gene_type:complete
MIKFFRRIRQNMVKENKVSKYFLYAIGEIVLVVIGILIALNINNWNENLKNDNLKEFYMQSLVEDLARDTLDINRVAAFQEKDLNMLKNFKTRIYNQSSTTLDTIRKIARFEFNSEYKVKRDYNNNTFNTIISTGNIELFDRNLIDELMLLQNYQLDEINRSKNNLDQYDIIYSNYSTRYPIIAKDKPKDNIVDRLLWSNIDEKDFVGNFVAILDSKQSTFRNTIMGQREVKDKSKEILLLLQGLINIDSLE